MGGWLISSLIVSLLLTIIFELIFAWLYGVREKRDLALLCLVNILTNPFVVFVYYLTGYFPIMNTYLTVIMLEIAAIFVEAYYYRTYGRGIQHPLLFSTGANSFSFVLGKAITLLF